MSVVSNNVIIYVFQAINLLDRPVSTASGPL
jgi:hypothetical protein